ncbi:helix-turn-helix transcriptional regulator [Phenylobacterium sp.]|uniref:helix-turn-helix transcriptional regulator n=1 Tax=Phenylobacterium sp. TaxID=1871053 RepID=UPI0025D8F133|nr:helix-turn-helix transcriptional regulator [Phenylobacterium sp.]
MLGKHAIDTFFVGATTPGLWPSALETIAQDLGADGATLTNGTAIPSRVSTSLGITSIVEEYFTLAAGFDSREDRVQPSPDGGFVGDFDNYAPDEIERDPFYMDFLRPRGFGWHAAAALSGGNSPLVLSLKRRWSLGPFQRDELERITVVLPHLRAAAYAAQVSLRFRSEDHLHALTAIGQGGLLLNREGRVLAHNAAVEFGDGLSLAEGHLKAAYASEQGALDRAVAIAVSRSPPSELPAPRAAVLHRPSGRRPLIVRIARLFDVAPNPIAQARALVSVIDTSTAPVATSDLLRQLFGLTPKESELVLLLGQGHTLSQAAELCRISLPHARQRLKIIFQKTETSRQGELVTLVMRLA